MRGPVIVEWKFKEALCLFFQNVYRRGQIRSFFHSLKCVCVRGNTSQPVIRGCYSEWRVHIFCLCGWQSVYWKSCSLWAHVAACAVSKSAPTEPLKCKRRARESVFVELRVWVERLRVVIFACVRVWVFDFVWRTLQIASEKPHQNTARTCPKRRIFFFPLRSWASGFKLPLWEPAFPSLPQTSCARLEGFRDEGECGPCFRVSQVCPLYTASGNNGRAKYLIYTPDPGTHLQIIKAGSWQRGESGNCNGCSQFIP